MIEKALSVKFGTEFHWGGGESQYREKIELPQLDTDVLENRAFRKRSTGIQLACGCMVPLAIIHSFTGQELPCPFGDSSHCPFGPRHEAANS